MSQKNAVCFGFAWTMGGAVVLEIHTAVPAWLVKLMCDVAIQLHEHDDMQPP